MDPLWSWWTGSFSKYGIFGPKGLHSRASGNKAIPNPCVKYWGYHVPLSVIEILAEPGDF